MMCDHKRRIKIWAVSVFAVKLLSLYLKITLRLAILNLPRILKLCNIRLFRNYSEYIGHIHFENNTFSRDRARYHLNSLITIILYRIICILRCMFTLLNMQLSHSVILACFRMRYGNGRLFQIVKSRKTGKFLVSFFS